MVVRVVDARNYGASTEVEQLCVSPRETHHRFRVADPADTFTSDCDCLRIWMRFIAGEDLSVV